MSQQRVWSSVSFLRQCCAAKSSSSRIHQRAFSQSAYQLEEQHSGTEKLPNANSSPSRRARSASALDQIIALNKSRNAPERLSGSNQRPQYQRQSPVRNGVSGPAYTTEKGAGTTPPTARSPLRSTTSPVGAPPQGQMARAPANFRLRRVTETSVTRDGMRQSGPNLDGRTRSGFRAKPQLSNERRGKKGAERPKKSSGDSSAKQSTSMFEIDPAETLSDGMVHQLLRLQRKEWDRVPYEPKYKLGSFDAQELIHEGRELFRGQSPPVKSWGPLEKSIGVVGMFGAEAHLKIRRVADGDEAAFGQEESDGAEVEKASR